MALIFQDNMRIGNIEIIFIKKSDLYCKHIFAVTKEVYEDDMKGKNCPKCHKPFQPWKPIWKDILGL